MSDEQTATSDRPAPKLPLGSTAPGTWTSPNGAELAYRAEAAWMALRDDDDEPVADIFSASYTADEAGPSRPVTFVQWLSMT